MPDENADPGSEEVTLLKTYPSLKEFASDYKLRSRLGWRVVQIAEPEKARYRAIPLCVLRRLSPRYQYRVTFVRKRF